MKIRDERFLVYIFLFIAMGVCAIGILSSMMMAFVDVIQKALAY